MEGKIGWHGRSYDQGVALAALGRLRARSTPKISTNADSGQNATPAQIALKRPTSLRKPGSLSSIAG
jgi:hypothetical protein